MHLTEADSGDAVAYQRKTLEIYYEFQWRSIVQTVELLTKGVTYYFTILAAIAGYVFTARLLPEEKKPLIIVSVTVSVLLAAIIITMGYGVLRGIGQMEATLAHYNAVAFVELSMPAYFKRAKIVGIVVAVCCMLILITIAGALAVKA